MKNLLGCGIALVWASAAHAEPMYVSDKLVIGVFADADDESTKVASLETGDAVEVFDRQDKHLHVRLNDGREGWVRATYLVKQAPAIVRLKELQANDAPAPTSITTPNPQQTQEIAALKEQNSALQAERDALKAAPPLPIVANAAVEKGEASRTMSEDSPMNAPPALQASWQPWVIAAVAVLSSGLLGFYFGYRTLASRIRRKYGSVKIY